MHIVHIINNLAKGGAEKLLVDVLPFFKNKGVSVSVLLLSKKNSAQPYLTLLSDHNIEVHWINEGSLYNLQNIFRIKKYIKQRQPNLVHVHLFPAMYWTAFAKIWGSGFPTVFTEHSNQNRRFNNPLFRPIDGFVYRSYNRIIAISPAIAKKLNAWTRLPENIKVIRNGVDTTRFLDAKAYDRKDFTVELNISPQAIMLMMTARFAYPKDHKTLVDVLKILPNDFVLLLVGEGEEKPEIETYVKQNGLEDRVRFLGFRTDIPRLMKTVDFNILSSRYEGMSGVTCEAMAAGKPFLGSDVPGINDVVPNTNFLFESGSAQQLAEKIINIQKDAVVAQTMEAEGLQQAANFDIALMVEKTIQLYQDILSEPNTKK